MDKIHVNGMKFYGYHGALPEENKLGQRFEVSLVLEMDITKAATTDDLNQTVNYADAYQGVKEVIEGKPVKLIETLSERIADLILTKFTKVQACTVKVIKPDPPIPGYYDSVAVEIKRGRA